MSSLDFYRKKTDRLLSEYRHVRRKWKDERVECATAKERAETSAKAQDFLQEVAKTVQQHVHDQIAGLVTKCLEVVFEEPYTFRIVFEKKRGKTEARLSFERNGEEFDPTWEAGGGVLDVAAFALRLACLLLVRPPARKVLILDEPFRCVDEVRLERVKELLLTLATDTGVQFILVTHEEGLKAGKVIRIPNQP